MLFCLNPVMTEGRHIYAYSPMRKKPPHERLNMKSDPNFTDGGMAFPDSNDLCGNSSDSSEEELNCEPKGQILSLNKLGIQG
jgi:hypothetical protein